MHDIKILMDAVNELMPALEEEADYICADRARLAAWANSEKSKIERSPGHPRELDDQVRELRKEVLEVKKEKELLERTLRQQVAQEVSEVEKEKDLVEQALRKEVAQAKEDKISVEREMERDKVAMEEEKGQLLAAVTQLQHTVESYEKKLESEAAAQNAQILSLVAKLEKEEAAHLFTSQQLESHATEIDRFESALQSCMDALAAGKQEKTMLQTSIAEHEASLLALETKCAAYEKQLQASAAQAHPPEEAPAEMTVKLDLDFSEAGAEGSSKRAQFQAALTDDLASAGEIAKDRVRISSVAPGSINATVAILPDATGQSAAPSAVAAKLQMQAGDPTSALFKGVLTCKCLGISVLPPAQASCQRSSNEAGSKEAGSNEAGGSAKGPESLGSSEGKEATDGNEATDGKDAVSSALSSSQQPPEDATAVAASAAPHCTGTDAQDLGAGGAQQALPDDQTHAQGVGTAAAHVLHTPQEPTEQAKMDDGAFQAAARRISV